MALPQNTTSTITRTAAFRSPRDRTITDYTCWERGGSALSVASGGLDTYNWYIRCDRATGAVYYSVPTDESLSGYIIPETLVHTIDPLPKQIAASFDTNMHPVVAWFDVNGDAFMRWFDPTVSNYVIMPLDATNSMRLALDDVRPPEPISGLTDTILAYTRYNHLYYRQLRDRFAIEYSVSAGFPALYQIGMNEVTRFQFARSPEPPDEDADLNYRTIDVRAGKIVGFDEEGNQTLYEFSTRTVDGFPGEATSVDKLVVTTDGQTFFLRGPDGAWYNTTVDIQVRFFLDTAALRAQRTFRFSIDHLGNITRETVEVDGEVAVRTKEAGAGTPSYTLTAWAQDARQGVTFHLISASALPSVGSFLPAWNADGDYYGGGFVPTGTIRYADYGSFVLLSADEGTYAQRSSSTRLRWGSGSIPESMCPVATRVVPCMVSNDGETVAGLMQVNADGSAEFWPLEEDGSNHLVRGEFVRTLASPKEKGLPANWQLVLPIASTSQFAFVPVLDSITPTSQARYSTGVTLTLDGSRFVDGRTVAVIAGVDAVTTFINTTQLTAPVPDSIFTLAGTYDVYVRTSPPGGGSSVAHKTLTVTNPAPTLSSVSPDTFDTSDTPIVLTLTGTNFVPESVAYYDGVAMVTTYVNSTTLTALTADHTAEGADTPDITVVNPTPGGGTSGAVTLTVTSALILQFTDGYTPPAGDSITLDFTNP